MRTNWDFSHWIQFFSWLKSLLSTTQTGFTGPLVSSIANNFFLVHWIFPKLLIGLIWSDLTALVYGEWLPHFESIRNPSLFVMLYETNSNMIYHDQLKERKKKTVVPFMLPSNFMLMNYWIIIPFQPQQMSMNL